MKPSYDPIKIKFITKVEGLQVPKGEIHIFEIINAQTAAYSFCSIERSQIGEEIIETYERLEKLSVCKACEDAWKADSRSPWKAWSKMTMQKEKE